MKVFIIAFVAALPAHAQMYKCVDGDRVAYGERPCERGVQTIVAAPDGPAMKAEPQELQRLQAESMKLQKERRLHEAQQDRLDAARDRQAARRRERCAKLDLARQWAEDDVRRATHHTADAARLKARRAAERHAAECK